MKTSGFNCLAWAALQSEGEFQGAEHGSPDLDPKNFRGGSRAPELKHKLPEKCKEHGCV